MQVRRTVDPYAILGVSRDATPLQVARAHRQLAKRHHPDLQGADAALIGPVIGMNDRMAAARELPTQLCLERMSGKVVDKDAQGIDHPRRSAFLTLRTGACQP